MIERPRNDEITYLTAQLVELEHERVESRDRAQLLVALQSTFTRIAVLRTPEEIVARTLQAVHGVLGFGRAIFYAAESATILRGRWFVDGSDTIEIGDECLDLRRGQAAMLVLSGDDEATIGVAGELSAPLVDVRRWYTLWPLRRVDGVIGLLYADGHLSARVRPWEASFVGALATIAGVAIENGVLLERTEHLANRDPLTGLYNRRAFFERLLAQIDFSRRTSSPLAFAMIDVDDFKAINDSHGHAHGDAVLRRLANTLTASCRGEDVVARFAGDEFVVMLVNCEPALAHRMIARISSDLQSADVSCSIGVAICPLHAADAESLLNLADRALYAAKANGKNGFAFHGTD